MAAVRQRAAATPRSRRVRIAEIVCGIALLVLPFVWTDPFVIDRFGRYLVWAIFAISVDLIWGYGGVLTFGHAAFFGAGGYLVAIFTVREGWFLPLPLLPAIGLSVLCVMLFAFLLSTLAFRGPSPMRGVELAVITLAVAFLLEQYARAGGDLTGGQNGIIIQPRLEFFGLDLHRGSGFYWLAAVLLVVVYVLARLYVSSRSGLITRGIRSNEDRVDMLGYRVPTVKINLFAMSAGFAALAGTVFFVHEGIVSPAAVGVTASTQVLLWVALGGRGTLIGPIVGTIVLQHLTATLSGSMLDTWLLIIGVLLIFVVMVFPSGILGLLDRGPAK